MAESYTKTECKLHGTPYCAALNMKNCADCFASKLDSEQQEALIEDIGYIAAALPEDGIESFLDEPECMLCKGSEKGKPEFFAQLSMGTIIRRLITWMKKAIKNTSAAQPCSYPCSFLPAASAAVCSCSHILYR